MASVSATNDSAAPPASPELDQKLKINDSDSEETKAMKLKGQASQEAQFIQGALNSVQVYQGGAKSVGAQT
jgi:hypothetical protein